MTLLGTWNAEELKVAHPDSGHALLDSGASPDSQPPATFQSFFNQLIKRQKD
jgi:hypothetical protein